MESITEAGPAVITIYPIKHAAIKVGNIVYVGKRHHNCFAVMAECGVKDREDAVQGFVDEAGFFYNRKASLWRAERFNQIIKKHPPYDQLLSEDLY